MTALRNIDPFARHVLDAHLDFMAELYQKTKSVDRVMDEYAETAKKCIEHYCECIAEAYLDGCKRAGKLWESNGLKMIHAFAVLDNHDDFIEEFDKNERSYEEYED